MDIKELFLRLVQIPSPSGYENEIRVWVAGYLEKVGIQTEAKGENLIGMIPGEGPKILLTAHLDTVQSPGEKIKPNWDGKSFQSDGTTILGADNKAGAAVLLAAAEYWTANKDKPNIILAFTAHEEAGEMSSGKLPINVIKPDLILNVDGGKAVGTIDTKALGQKVFEIEVIGKSAHAAQNPERGRHAILTAAKIVTQIKMGKRQNGDTINIGLIHGGEATNIIPDKTYIKGEVRSFSDKGLAMLIKEIQFICQTMAKESHTQVVIRELPGGTSTWKETKSNKWLPVFVQAAKQAGVPFKTTFMSASSDANPLSKYGIPVYSINRGGKNPHSKDESITLTEMEDVKRFIIEIIKLCH